jgi:hypothetical protein
MKTEIKVSPCPMFFQKSDWANAENFFRLDISILKKYITRGGTSNLQKTSKMDRTYSFVLLKILWSSKMLILHLFNPLANLGANIVDV